MSEKKSVDLSGVDLDAKSFLALLTEIMSHSEKVQNHPPDHVPQEELVADAVIRFLAPYSGDKGPLVIKKCMYVKGRANLIITYPGKDKKKVISFVGSHMDVVPANPEEFTKCPPFKLTQDGDKLWGRGVTDCLGHVAMLSEVFRLLAVNKPQLEHSVVAVFIANEENSSIPGIGIDEMEKQGELEFLKNGPLYWVDSANFGPTLGTGGMVGWEITVGGKRFHSGIPQKAINPIELAMEVVKHCQTRFYKDFSKFADEEKKYMFQVPSSMKPTQISTPPGSLNQIPGSVTVAGDIRFTPFYNSTDVKKTIESYIAELDVTTLPSLGASKYHLPEENLKGTVELKWLGAPYEGVAVKLDSPGYKALHDAVAATCGKATPFSLTGSLPIIRDLQNSGFDVQICGFGRLDAYHANNEYGMLSEFGQGARIVLLAIQNLEHLNK